MKLKKNHETLDFDKIGKQVAKYFSSLNLDNLKILSLLFVLKLFSTSFFPQLYLNVSTQEPSDLSISNSYFKRVIILYTLKKSLSSQKLLSKKTESVFITS